MQAQLKQLLGLFGLAFLLAQGCAEVPDGGECGDGVVQPWEACDDGNDDNADRCTNHCALPRCGDRIQQAGEACERC